MTLSRIRNARLLALTAVVALALTACSEGGKQDTAENSGGGGNAAGSSGYTIAMVTHEAPEQAVAHALELLEGSPSVTEPPLVMHLLG